jgi:hypothetical protein
LVYPANIYLYVDAGTNCVAQPNNGFGFTSWVENPLLNPDLSVPLNSSGNLTVNPFGTFTANFQTLPVIPLDQFVTLIATIIGSAWFLPVLATSFKTRVQLKNLEECISQIGKLDKNSIEDKMKRYYLSGKISDDHRQFLKDSISEYYDNTKGS